ncbi:MAG: ATP-dependent metalloprotease, partial [Deltaproteobacteria bacterium]|nr:ATP-dependent metalloprotease [Deltaproteobacteria bacterium]
LMAEALIKYETIDADQIKELMDGKPPKPPSDWSDEGPTNGKHTAADAEEVEKKAEDEKAKDGKIGGPASLH